MRAVGYTRVSTVDQAQEGVSLDAQKARIAAWCRAEGHDLAEGDFHCDAGISGKRADNRPALQAALGAVCGTGGVLVVYSLSRLARSVRDTLQIAERLELAGADLVSLSEKIDTTTAAGTMVFRLLAVLAEFERDLIVERTRGAVAHKRARGERLGTVPYGSRLADDGRTLEPEPEDARAIALAHALHSQAKLSLRAIAARLDARGLPTKSRRPWSASSVRILLSRTPEDEDAPEDEADSQREEHPELPAPRGDRGAGPERLRSRREGGPGPADREPVRGGDAGPDPGLGRPDRGGAGAAIG